MSLLFFQKLAEERIAEALKNGELDAPSYKGKPLQLEEKNPFMPEELRLAYKILKNAGFLPKEVELMKEIKRIEELLEGETQDAYLKIRKLNAYIFKLNQIRKTSIQVEQIYYNKIAQRIKLAKEEKKTGSKEINWSKLQIQLYVSAISPKRR